MGTPETEDGAAEEPQDVGPSKPAVSLPQHGATVTVHGRVSEEVGASPGGWRRDSLEDTRTFYGLRPLSPPSTSLHRVPSSSSRTWHTRNRSNSASRRSSTTTAGAASPDASSFVTSPSRRSMAMPVPRGFLTPKKPQAALKLEEKQRQAALRDPHPASQSVQPGVSEGVADGATQLSADSMSAFMRAAPSQAAGTNTFSSLTTLNEVETVQISAKPESPPLIEALEQGHADLRPVSTWDRERERDGDRDLRYSVTDASSPPRTHLAELSSDDLVRPSNADFAEKNLVNGRAHGHSSHPLRSSFVVKRASVGRKGSGSPEGQKTAPTSYRRYTHFENSLQSWFCGGHLMSGGDNLFSFAMTLVLLLGITGVWIGTTGVWLWHHGREYGLTRGGGVAVVIIFVYLFGITFSSLLVSAFRDPGIIPRGLDPDPPTTNEGSWPEALDREFAVCNGRVTVRYCETCKTYRPPRASHCRLCGNCVDGIDHHCSYLHTCVGKRTYFSFLTLLMTATIANIYVVIFSAIHFSLLCHHDHIGFGQAIKESPGAAVSFLLGVGVLPFVGFLLWYHLRLLLYNLTTIEQIRASTSTNLFRATKRPDNPFAADSVSANVVLSSLGRPQFPSWVQGWKWEERDKRVANPALTEARWLNAGPGRW